jgi:hypothetical protein
MPLLPKWICGPAPRQLLCKRGHLWTALRLQSVRVKSRRGHVVLAADAAHLYAHVDTGMRMSIPAASFRSHINVEQVVEGDATLKKLATSRVHVVPSHDPPVLATYPAAKPGLEGWVVRLDVASKWVSTTTATKASS